MRNPIGLKRRGKLLRSDISSQQFYDQWGETKIFKPGQFVSDADIEKFSIPDKYFVHPDSLRILGAFDFAYKKKGRFTVGVIRTARGAGDILIATVLAKALKAEYGKYVSVWFCVLPEYAALLRHNPWIDRVFTSREQLERAKPDVVFNTNDLEFRAPVKEFESPEHFKNRTDIYLEGIGLYVENKTPLYVVTEAERKWAKEELSRKGYKEGVPLIGIQMQASNPSRTYPRMAEVVGLLKQQGYQVFILDNKTKRGKWEYNLRQVGALVEQMDLLITPDSFFYHLAGALKKRAIVLFGSTDGKVWVEDYEKVTPVEIPCPRGLRRKCWWRLECIPGNSLEEKAKKATPQCLALIDPQKIMMEVDKHFKAKKILVVFLTYNFLTLSKQAIDSVRSFHNYDIFVVDNESSDGTVDWLKEEGINYISKKTTVAQAYNIGLKRAYEGGYDYCLLCNNDIILASDYIDTVVETAERRGSYLVVGKVVEGSQYYSDFRRRDIEASVSMMEAGDYSAVLISRNCIKEIGKFDERFGPRYQEDEDHLLRVRLAGHEFIRTYRTCFLHLLGQVVKAIPKERISHEANWQRNVALFKKKWHIDPYLQRQDLPNLKLIRDKNPDWKDKIKIPFSDTSKKYKEADSFDTPKKLLDTVIRKHGRAKVLVVRRMGGYGDILFTTVLAKALKKQYGSKVRVEYAVLKEFMPVLENNPYIDEIKLAGEIRGDYDFIADVTDYEFEIELRELEAFDKIKSARTEIYLNMMGLKGSLQPCYVVTPQEAKWAEEQWKFAGKKARIVVIREGSNLMKIWPRMDELVKLLRDRGHAVLVLDKRNPEGRYIYSFRQSAALIKVADLVVSPDTGMSNLAATLDIPVVTIFSNRNGKVFAKMFKTMIPVQGDCPCLEENYCDFKAPCLFGELREYRKKENVEIPECLKRLPVEKVYREVAKALKKQGKGKG